MKNKIKIAVVDDDESLHDILLDLYRDSDFIDIKYNYTESRRFMEEAPMLDFDLCLFDISMPEMDGLTLAQILKNKPFIFVTGSEDRLKEALGLAPMDVVTKPFNKERLDQALLRANKLIGEKIEYGLFNVAESRYKVNIALGDIVYVTTDDVDPRHKAIVLKDGTKYTLMNYRLNDILSFAPQLVQINRQQLLSIKYMSEMQHDSINVKGGKELGIPEEVTISETCKKEVMKRIFYKK